MIIQKKNIMIQMKRKASVLEMKRKISNHVILYLKDKIMLERNEASHEKQNTKNDL